jgi:hypothetical protein
VQVFRLIDGSFVRTFGENVLQHPRACVVSGERFFVCDWRGVRALLLVRSLRTDLAHFDHLDRAHLVVLDHEVVVRADEGLLALSAADGCFLRAFEEPSVCTRVFWPCPHPGKSGSWALIFDDGGSSMKIPAYT